MSVRDSSQWWIGEAGDIFRVDVGQLVTGVTEATIIFQKPDQATAVQKTLSSGPTTRYWDYTMEASLLDMEGTWHYQATLTRAAGPKISKRGSFDVGQPLVVAP
jgi:hypothetical protein